LFFFFPFFFELSCLFWSTKAFLGGNPENLAEAPRHPRNVAERDSALSERVHELERKFNASEEARLAAERERDASQATVTELTSRLEEAERSLKLREGELEALVTLNKVSSLGGLRRTSIIFLVRPFLDNFEPHFLF
jgi:septal ring factor EnvC (AmiA/AmiB activator)